MTDQWQSTKQLKLTNQECYCIRSGKCQDLKKLLLKSFCKFSSKWTDVWIPVRCVGQPMLILDANSAFWLSPSVHFWSNLETKKKNLHSNLHTHQPHWNCKCLHRTDVSLSSDWVHRGDNSTNGHVLLNTKTYFFSSLSDLKMLVISSAVHYL